MVLLGLFWVDSSVPFIDLIEHIERLADRCPNRVASIDELPLVTDVLVEVIKQFLRDLDADLRHTLVFSEEYLHSVAQHIGPAGSVNRRLVELTAESRPIERGYDY